MHDRIQQATYELIEEQDKSNIHLKIGRLLIKENPLVENEERLFVVLKHFNQSISLIEDIEERHLLAKYNYWASQKAKLASAYYAANEHLAAGMQFLEPNNWKKNYNLSFLLYKEFAICKYLMGEFEIAEQYFADLLKHSQSALDNLEIYRLKIEMLSMLGKHNEALKIGLDALRDFKIRIPSDPSVVHILSSVYKIKFQLRKTKIEDINLPPMLDLKQKAIVDLITQLYNSAFITNQKLFVLLTCKNISLSLKYGYTESTSMSIPVYAFIIMHSLNLYDEAISFVRLYNRLKQEYGASNFEGKNQFVIGSFVEPYQISLDACSSRINHAFELCCDVGDLVYSNYSKLLLVIHSISTGKNLEEVKKHIQSALSFMLRVKVSDFMNVIKFWEYSIQCLENPEMASFEQFADFEKSITDGSSKTELSFLYSSTARLYFLLGKFEEAIRVGEIHEQYSDYDKGLVSHLDGKFYFAMAIFCHYPQLPKNQQKNYLKKLKQIYALLEKYAAWCPDNYKPYSLLLACEFARLGQRPEPALALYEQTIKAAQASGLGLLAAIASERAGVHCLEINLERVAQIYLNNAEHFFKKWGSKTKVKLVEQLNPRHRLNNGTTIKGSVLPSTSANSTIEGSMDMMAILKFTQELSTEIRIDKLLQKLLVIALEITGAERCIILSKFNEQWMVEVDGDSSQQHLYLKNVLVSEYSARYPLSVLNYVERTEEPFALTRGEVSDIALQDAYIQQVNPQSLLMIPLFYQGQLCRVLYVENTVKPTIITQNHLSGIQLLGSRSMGSIEKAKHFFLATHDPVTGLANRNMLYEWFKITSKQLAREQGQVSLL